MAIELNEDSLWENPAVSPQGTSESGLGGVRSNVAQKSVVSICCELRIGTRMLTMLYCDGCVLLLSSELAVR